MSSQADKRDRPKAPKVRRRWPRRPIVKPHGTRKGKRGYTRVNRGKQAIEHRRRIDEA